MNKAPDAWHLPPSPPEVVWLGRISSILMLVLVCAWAAVSVFDMVQYGSFSVWQILALLSALAWLAMFGRCWIPLLPATPLVLHWFDDAACHENAVMPRKRAHISNHDSHWCTTDSQAVALRVMLDLGTHILVRVSLGGCQHHHQWVRDQALSGPWRWRIMVNSPQKKLQKTVNYVSLRGRKKDARHHRSP